MNIAEATTEELERVVLDTLIKAVSDDGSCRWFEAAEDIMEMVRELARRSIKTEDIEAFRAVVRKTRMAFREQKPFWDRLPRSVCMAISKDVEKELEQEQ